MTQLNGQAKLTTKCVVYCRYIYTIIINLFINRDVILNRHALWSIQGKKYTIQEKYCNERFLSYNGDMSINFRSILCYQFACMA